MRRRSRRLWLTVAMACVAATGASARPQPMSPTAMSSTVARVLLALDRLQADRWYPSTPESERAIASDRALVGMALLSTNATVRRIAVRGIGRFENPADVRTLAPFLGDIDPVVRREAAGAVAQAVEQSKDADVLPAFAALRSPVPFASAPDTDEQTTARNAVLAAAANDARLQGLARLHYDHGTAQQVIETIDPGRPGDILVMLRRDGELRVTPDQLAALRLLARPIRPMVAPSRDALEVVMRMGNVDPLLIAWAAQYKCARFDPAAPACGWEIRDLAVMNMAPLDAFLGPMLDVARHDPAPEVRIMALRKIAGGIEETKTCAAMIESLDDGTEFDVVRLEAIDLMDPRCVEREDISRRLEAWATDLTLKDRWSLAAHALERLALIDPPKAAKLVAEFGSTHDLWPLRAASARAARTLRDVATLQRLATDDEPNVRTEAIGALAGLKDASVTALARKALSSPDDQLVITAARALRETTEREAALFDLVAALKRLTEGGRDGSRFPRLAILDCLKAWAPPRDGVTVVLPYVDVLKALLRDFDPAVAAEAADVIGLATGDRPVPQPTRRAADQPTEEELRRLPHSATIRLDNFAVFRLALLPDDAPLAVARFARLARTHYFDHQMLIYRLNVLATASGGSPGANEYAGDARFLRDEIGSERHVAGSVALATHGRDAGDARFFIDLIDQPGFDGQYTVFGRLIAMMPEDPLHPRLAATNRLLEGGTILSVELDVR
jgi:cyclophilin family peptidyl-prolyl cis-trans isomerase/HEAT repeat protein